MRANCAVRIPKEAADEGEQEHGWLADGDGRAEESQLNE